MAGTSKPVEIIGLENRLLAALEPQAYARLVPLIPVPDQPKDTGYCVKGNRK